MHLDYHVEKPVNVMSESITDRQHGADSGCVTHHRISRPCSVNVFGTSHTYFCIIAHGKLSVRQAFSRSFLSIRISELACSPGIQLCWCTMKVGRVLKLVASFVLCGRAGRDVGFEEMRRDRDGGEVIEQKQPINVGRLGYI